MTRDRIVVELNDTDGLLVSGTDQLLKGKGSVCLDFLKWEDCWCGCVGSPRGEGMTGHELLGKMLSEGGGGEGAIYCESGSVSLKKRIRTGCEIEIRFSKIGVWWRSSSG